MQNLSNMYAVFTVYTMEGIADRKMAINFWKMTFKGSTFLLQSRLKSQNHDI